jgi:pimeloyl-ACP methyl ester carboxylesterase
MNILKTNTDNYYYSKGSGKPMVLLHGFPDCAQNYENQMNYFSELGYEVFCPFMPGYHPDDKALSSYDPTSISLEIINFIKSLNVGPVTLMGHDWGSSAAYGVASLEPSLVSQLVTLSVPHGSKLMEAILTNGDQQRRSWYMFYFQLEFADMAVPINDYEFIDRLWREWSPNWPEYNKYSKNTIKVLSEVGVLNKALAYYRSTLQPTSPIPELNAEQLEQKEQKISCPTLYLHGINDGCIGSDLVDGMEEGFEDLTVKILDDCGHFLHLEKPDEVNKIISEFLSSREA